jgi:hypothetical protein
LRGVPLAQLLKATDDMAKTAAAVRNTREAHLKQMVLRCDLKRAEAYYDRIDLVASNFDKGVKAAALVSGMVIVDRLRAPLRLC